MILQTLTRLANDTHNANPPSAQLLKLGREYLAMVDGPDGHTFTSEHNAERTAAHDALIEQLRAEDFIGTPNRVQARRRAVMCNPSSVSRRRDSNGMMKKRQLAHDDLTHALLQLNPDLNPNDFDD